MCSWSRWRFRLCGAVWFQLQRLLNRHKVPDWSNHALRPRRVSVVHTRPILGSKLRSKSGQNLPKLWHETSRLNLTCHMYDKLYYALLYDTPMDDNAADGMTSCNPSWPCLIYITESASTRKSRAGLYYFAKHSLWAFSFLRFLLFCLPYLPWRYRSVNINMMNNSTSTQGKVFFLVLKRNSEIPYRSAS